mmetsp:Transcript_51736/g.155268  ORF Transcript_51736/g.155268 Transcript_51736/m.155268 type:complete len:120 (-) Transcript_51736:1461-1820(-)
MVKCTGCKYKDVVAVKKLNLGPGYSVLRYYLKLAKEDDPDLTEIDLRGGDIVKDPDSFNTWGTGRISEIGDEGAAQLVDSLSYKPTWGSYIWGKTGSALMGPDPSLASFKLTQRLRISI